MYEQALKRPEYYHSLSAREQWAIDKRLGILDWDGTDDRPVTPPKFDSRVLDQPLPGYPRTIRQILKDTLKDLINEGESFGGKDWENDFITPLIQAGLVKEVLSDSGLYHTTDWGDFRRFMLECIAAL